MAWGKKNALGFKQKPRTQQEIDHEYNFHAANIGHKLDTIRELEEQLETHRAGLIACKAESAARRKMEPAPQAPAPAQTNEPPVSQL